MVVVIKMVMTLKEGKGGLLIDSQEGREAQRKRGSSEDAGRGQGSTNCIKVVVASKKQGELIATREPRSESRPQAKDTGDE